MGDGPTRYFASVIHEYAAKIGKERFLLMGEITGGRAYDTVQVTGLDAALGIGGVQEKLWKVPRGDVNPDEYFDQFRNALYLNQGSHTWFRDKVVTMIDDHDQVWRGGTKGRFCSVDKNEKLVAAAVMLNLCTLGIPCIYYGGGGPDRYIREAMFGGGFGAFRSKGVHFFNEQHSAYKAIAEVAELRKQEITLRRGRQYLRDISGDGEHFGPTRKLGEGPIQGIIAWSRLFADEEIVCAISTDPVNAHEVWVNVDVEVHPPGSTMTFLFPSGGGQVGVEFRSGRSVIHLASVKAGEFVILK
jgi:hypothetical protein